MFILIILQALLALALLFLTVSYIYFYYQYGYWERRGVPYEKPTMFLGNLNAIMRTSMFDLLKSLGQKYEGGVVGIFFAWKPVLVVNAKEHAKSVVVKEFDLFQNRHCYPGDVTDPLGSLNLFTVKNPTWSAVRHEIAPMFTSSRLKKVTELMNMNSTELVQRIQADHIDDKKPVDLKNLFSMYTSDTVAFTAFGLRVSVLRGLTSPLWFITQHMVRWTFWRGLEFTVIFFIPTIARYLRLKFFSKDATDYIKNLFSNVVKERNNKSTSDDKDLVNHLLKIKENLKLPVEDGSEGADDLMMAQAAIFILGAIETSSTTLTYLAHELAYHPDKQEKLYLEVKKALEEKGKDVLDFNDLLEVHYLTACIKETLRKFPPVPFLERVCNQTFQLTDKVTIEKGTPVYVNVLGIHYNEEYYPEPEKWLPERFGNTSDNDNRDFTFIPFGEGPRFCIGKRYGLMQIRTAIAQMVMKFRFEPDEEYNVKTDPYSVILGPKSGGRVKFIPRSI